MHNIRLEALVAKKERFNKMTRHFDSGSFGASSSVKLTSSGLKRNAVVRPSTCLLYIIISP